MSDIHETVDGNIKSSDALAASHTSPSFDDNVPLPQRTCSSFISAMSFWALPTTILL